jgi:hypothetical protein
MEKKEIIRDLLLILCVFVLLIIPWASVFGIQDPGLLEAAGIFQHSAGFVLITTMVLYLVYQIYGKPLTQEMKEEEIRESDQKERKQFLFKPTISVIIFFLLLIFMGIWLFIRGIFPSEPNEDVFACIFGSFFLIGLSLFLCYKTPVFIFTEDSLHIKSHLFYLLCIDRKTVIRYADITSVRPDAEAEGMLNMYGLDSRHRIVISTEGTTQAYGLAGYNPYIIAKIYLRFKEKLGDKVTLQ